LLNLRCGPEVVLVAEAGLLAAGVEGAAVGGSGSEEGVAL